MDDELSLLEGVSTTVSGYPLDWDILPNPTFYPPIEFPLDPTFCPPSIEFPLDPTFCPSPIELPLDPTFYPPPIEFALNPTFCPSPSELPLDPTFYPPPIELPLDPTFYPPPIELALDPTFYPPYPPPIEIPLDPTFYPPPIPLNGPTLFPPDQDLFGLGLHYPPPQPLPAPIVGGCYPQTHDAAWAHTEPQASATFDMNFAVQDNWHLPGEGEASTAGPQRVQRQRKGRAPYTANKSEGAKKSKYKSQKPLVLSETPIYEQSGPTSKTVKRRPNQPRKRRKMFGEQPVFAVNRQPPIIKTPYPETTESPVEASREAAMSVVHANGRKFRGDQGEFGALTFVPQCKWW